MQTKPTPASSLFLVGGLNFHHGAQSLLACLHLRAVCGSRAVKVKYKNDLYLSKCRYFEQCKVLGAPSLHPIWTSFGLRRWQALWQTGAKEETQQLGIAKQSAGEWPSQHEARRNEEEVQMTASIIMKEIKRSFFFSHLVISMARLLREVCHPQKQYKCECMQPCATDIM